MNKHILTGNLTRDPEIRTTQSDKRVANFTLAVNNGKDREATYYRISAFDHQAEAAMDFLKKGSKCLVEANNMRANQYTNAKGESRVDLEVIADRVEFMNPRRGDADDAVNGKSEAPSYPSGSMDKARAIASAHAATVVEDETLPF